MTDLNRTNEVDSETALDDVVLSEAEVVASAGNEDKVLYRVQDFHKGSIVWAKCSKRFPAWPAIVIDPNQEAPKAVRKACVPNTICVMFYGFTKKQQREYGWIKDGMIFPFLEYLESFQGQTQLYGSTPDDFRMAIHEAYQARNGYLNTSDQIPESSHRGQRIKQHCGICKKILHYSDVAADYIFCDCCNNCVHTQCAKVSIGVLKKVPYYCPACKGKSSIDQPATVKIQEPKLRSDDSNDTISVICNGNEGIYYPKYHQVECICGSCGTKKQSLGEWERHSGSKAKKWKVSVKVKDSNITLEQWLARHNVVPC